MLKPKPLLATAALAAVGLAVAAAGWWTFMREDAQLATSAPEVPADLVEASATQTPNVSGSQSAPETAMFRVIPERSEAAYFVDEELATLPLPSTAKGATRAVDGALQLSLDGTELAADGSSQFMVDLRTLTSDESRRDNRVQEALETGAYPVATFTIASITGYDPAIPEGQEQTLELAGSLDLHGVQKEVTWEVKAVRQANVLTALATTTIAFADFNITPPNIAGFVSVEDEATLQVQLVAEAV